MILFEILYPIHYTCIRDSKLYMYTVNALGYRSVGLTSRRATVPIIKKEILQFKAQKNALVLADSSYFRTQSIQISDSKNISRTFYLHLKLFETPAP